MSLFLLRLLKVCFGCLIVVGVILALIPTWLSTNWGLQQTLKVVNHFIPGQMEVRALYLHWGKGQSLEGFRLKNRNGQSVLAIEKLSTEADLWSLLNQSTHWGKTHVEQLQALLIVDQAGEIHLQHAWAFSSMQDLPVHFHLELSQVNADLQLFVDHQPPSIWAKGVLQQDLVGSFEVNATLNGLYAENWRALWEKIPQYFNQEGQQAKIQLQVAQLATESIDRLFLFQDPRLTQVFSSLFGDHFTLIFDKDPDQNGIFNLSVQAPLMTGKLKGKLLDGLFTLQERATFDLQLNPKLVNAFTPPRTHLHQSTPLRVELPYLFFPLALLDKNNPEDFCQCGFKIEAAIAKTDMNIHPLGLVNLHHFKTAVDSSIGDRNMHFTLIGYAEYYQTPLNINYEIWFKKPTNLLTFLEKPRFEHPVSSNR